MEWVVSVSLVTIIARSLAVMVSGERQRASQVLYGEILYIEIRSWLSIKYTNIHKWPTHFLWPMNAQSCYASHQQGFITIPSVLKKTPTLFWIKDTFLLTLERRHFLPEPITRDRVFQNRPFRSERPAAYCRKSHSCYRHQGVFQVSQGSRGFCLIPRSTIINRLTMDMQTALRTLSQDLPYRLCPEHSTVLEQLDQGRHVFVSLPTGYGKSECLTVFPKLMDLLRGPYESNSSITWSYLWGGLVRGKKKKIL